ncbi:MAG: ABC transporter substrate-binding protein [Bacteroidetes bacterium]|nr:ABC transporter substrate-binding protein [Bacteroidota bacterium]
MNTIIKIGGVPEHFNLPIIMAIEGGEFAAHGIDLQWTYYPGGTGAMTRALAEGEIDLAILLTEGFVSAVNNGLQAKIVKIYIESPLVWGIYTGAHSPTVSLYDSTSKKYAISRLGSGSHLMAMIHAEQRGDKLSKEDFVIIDSLEGAIESLTKGETQVFYWEKFMTKKYVDSGDLRLIGEFSAPWSSFLITASDKALYENKQQIHIAMEIINDAGQRFKNDKSIAAELKKRFGLNTKDVAKWLGGTIWNTDFSIRRKGLDNAIEALNKIRPTPVHIDMEALCANMKVK